MMIEIKTFLGEWKEVTKEQAESFYNHFCRHATAIKQEEKQEYFNKNHIRGGYILLNGTVKTENITYL